MIRIGIVGAGAIAERHGHALAALSGCEIAAVTSRTGEESRAFSAQFNVPHILDSLESMLASDAVDAIILCTPTQMHAEQALQCLAAGKHVMVEIPIADRAGDATRLQFAAEQAAAICMPAHTSRFYPGNRYLHEKVEAGTFSVQQMDVQTYFLRRSNLNAKGQPRVWTDHLLWHHAAHTIDLFAWQAGPIVKAQAMQGPIHPELGIAMDMSIQLKSESGALCTLSLSFNNDGPLGSTVRYIGDNGTYVALRQGLSDGHGQPIDLDAAGFSTEASVAQDGEFLAAIREGRQPRPNVASVIHCYHVIEDIERQLAEG